jgi:hypothetical protein
MNRIALALCAATLAGCCAKSPPPPEPAAPGTATTGVIEAMSGKVQIDAGRKAADKIKAVSAEKKSELDAVQQP